MSQTEHNLGPQPIIEVLQKHKLIAHDLVAASTEQLTHKMVARGRKGRRLKPGVQKKILNALNSAAKGKDGAREFGISDLFNY